MIDYCPECGSDQWDGKHLCPACGFPHSRTRKAKMITALRSLPIQKRRNNMKNKNNLKSKKYRRQSQALARWRGRL